MEIREAFSSKAIRPARIHGGWIALVSGDRTERSEIGNRRAGVLTGHVELRHRRAERLARFPDAGGEEGDEFGVASRRRASDSWGLQGPVRYRYGRL
jgi:hypothetical protein